MMDRAPSYKKANIIAIGIVIINLAILSFGGWFLTDRVAKSSNQLAEEKGMLEAIEKNWGQISRGQKEIDETRPQIEKLSKAFISMTEPIDFINSLENLAKKTNNIFEINLSSSPADTKSKENALFFQIKLAGSFADTMHFLNYLENMEYRVQVLSIDMNKIAVRLPEIGDVKQFPPNSVYTLITLKAFTQ